MLIWFYIYGKSLALVLVRLIRSLRAFFCILKKARLECVWGKKNLHYNQLYFFFFTLIVLLKKGFVLTTISVKSYQDSNGHKWNEKKEPWVFNSQPWLWLQRWVLLWGRASWGFSYDRDRLIAKGSEPRLGSGSSPSRAPHCCIGVKWQLCICCKA